ncbi:MAG: RNA polymerase sigma factor [Dermatophilaceae bacterium]
MIESAAEKVDQADELDRLARQAAAGDAAALNQLLTLVRPQVLRRCQRVLPYVTDAEDACQEALLAVARGISSFEGRSRFTTWMFPVVARSSFATYRRMRSHAPVLAGEVPDIADPRRMSVLAGARVDLVDALEKLTDSKPHVVEPVVLRDLMGMSYDEIAERMAIPVGTVKSRINHGRAALRETLTPPGR